MVPGSLGLPVRMFSPSGHDDFSSDGVELKPRLVAVVYLTGFLPQPMLLQGGSEELEVFFDGPPLGTGCPPTVNDVWGPGSKAMVVPLPEVDPPRLAKHGLGCIGMTVIVDGQSVGQDLRLRQWKPMTGRIQTVFHQGILICRGEKWPPTMDTVRGHPSTDSVIQAGLRDPKPFGCLPISEPACFHLLHGPFHGLRGPLPRLPLPLGHLPQIWHL